MKKTVFCGREIELGRLRSEWTRVVDDGDAQVVVLLADNGLGKTRLVLKWTPDLGPWVKV
jgi:hypothetical protein